MLMQEKSRICPGRIPAGLVPTLTFTDTREVPISIGHSSSSVPHDSLPY